MEAEQQLDLVSLAWGRQDGWCFFPWISGDAENREERIQSYHEGRAFHWPEERREILQHMQEHKEDDLYWCPSLFESPHRRMDQAMDEHALWADLDAVDPRGIEDEYRPSIAWETSPGRYQGLWLIQRGFDVQGASWAGGENQRLTYWLGADPSGWDTTQLLRIPGWRNHKPEYRAGNDGRPVEGRLLWYDRTRRYLPDHFSDLPEVDAPTAGLKDVLDAEIERVDRFDVWGRVRLKVNKAVREYMAAREPGAGDRSEILWQMERELADAGCTVVEIVALVRETVWNKYAGRSDELRRLTNEAAKAVMARSSEVKDKIQESLERRGKFADLDQQLEGLRPPEWLVEGIWVMGGCGFIAGEPKSFKSWMALDLALSIATGADFLGQFRVVRPGPVGMVLEEDGLRRIKDRRDKIWPSKQTDRMRVEVDENGREQVVWEPASPLPKARISALVKQGFVASDPAWQAWLDEELEQGYGDKGERYRAIILDPFLMMLGDVDENKAGPLNTQIFKPLKDLADKHDVAIVVVHHLRKAGRDGGAAVRGGQMMLGSVAFHGWTDDAMYIQHARGDLKVEVETKDGAGGSFRITGLRRKGWYPGITDLKLEMDEDPGEESGGLELGAGSEVRTAKKERGGRTPGRKVVEVLRELGGDETTAAVAQAAGLTLDGARKQLTRSPQVRKLADGRWRLLR